MSQELIMNANPLVAFLKKPATQFTKADIISYIQENEITMVNFMYPAGDGRLKTLNFVINNLEYLETILCNLSNGKIINLQGKDYGF